MSPGLLTHLTRLTRLCIRPYASSEHNAIRVPNDPAALPSAGGSLRVLELARDYAGRSSRDPRVCIEALLPCAGLKSLRIGKSRMGVADAARLAAALPRLERLVVDRVEGAPPAALAAALRALPRLTTLQLNGKTVPARFPGVGGAAGAAPPDDSAAQS
jgi:hypothetical protein